MRELAEEIMRRVGGTYILAGGGRQRRSRNSVHRSSHKSRVRRTRRH
jgi:hypothetical protein